LTLKEIAKRLGVPESNLRYYRNRIGDFLPSAGKGRRRRYFPEAEEIFRKTIEYVNGGVTLDRVYAIFAENKPLSLSEDIARPAQEELARIIISKLKEEADFFPSVADADTGQGDSATVAALSRLQEDVAALRTELASVPAPVGPEPELFAELQDMRDRLDVLEKENEALRDELAQKDTILDRQKIALIDAREKRRQLIEELERLKPDQSPPE